MNSLSDAQLLKQYILSLDDFVLTTKPYEGYKHMGAILTDAILQAGLNYKTVVAPRVQRVIKQYPEALTTSKFLSIIREDGADHVLNWRHPEKPRRLYEITAFLDQLSIDTDKDLHNWLLNKSNSESLLQINGIGPKTRDYLKNLVNISSVAVDRHIRNFVQSAGILNKEYAELQLIVETTANLLKISSSSLDHAIWLYMSSKYSTDKPQFKL
jgi:hypothetical protein